jgi:hypothetical protein
MSANTPFIPPLLTPSSSNRSLGHETPHPSNLNGRPPLLSPNAPIPAHIAAAWGQQQSGQQQPPMHRRAHSSPWTVGRDDLNNMSTEEFLRSQPPPNVTTTWVGMNNNSAWTGASPYNPPQAFTSPVHPPANLMSPPLPPANNLSAPWGHHPQSAHNSPAPQQAQPQNTPVMGFGFGGPPPQSYQAFSPMGAPPQPVWGAAPAWGPPPMTTPYVYPQQISMMPPSAMGGMPMNLGGYGMPPPQAMAPPPPAPQQMAPIPPGDSSDKLDRFLEGKGCTLPFLAWDKTPIQPLEYQTHEILNRWTCTRNSTTQTARGNITYQPTPRRTT